MTKQPHNRFPVYIPSKGRADYMITSRYLSEMGVEHYIIAEPHEVSDYREAAKNLAAEVISLDMKFKEEYETCDDIGLSRSTGPGPARNFAWSHAIGNGAEWHWVMDDNIRGFYRFNKNLKVPCTSSAWFAAQEDFCLRYINVAMAGPNYFMFQSRKNRAPPFVANTRIYSCNLIRNDVPFRWRGRYNEDTILSLDMLKAGWCTIQFNAFLQRKIPTQTVKGGNTKEFYHAEGERKAGEKYARGGTVNKSKMLAEVHPDVAKVVWRFKRWHHYVDYSLFKNQKLIRRDPGATFDKPNNYGMTLTTKRRKNADAA